MSRPSYPEFDFNGLGVYTNADEDLLPFSSWRNTYLRTFQFLEDVQRVENETAISTYIEQRNAAQNALERGEYLFANGLIDAEDIAEIRTKVTEFLDTSEPVVTSIRAAMQRLADAYKALMLSIAQGTGDIASVAGNATRTAIELARKNAEEAIKIATAKYESLVSDSAAASERYTRAVTKIIHFHDNRDPNVPLTPEEIEELDKLRDEMVDAGNAVEAAKGAASIQKSLLQRIIDAARAAIDAAEVYDASTFVVNKVIRAIGKELAEYVAIFDKFAGQMKRVMTIVSKGYEALADSLLVGKDITKFLAEVNNVTEEVVKEGKGRMKKQMAAIQRIMAEEGKLPGEEISEKVLAEASKWMSPSWRLIASFDEDLRAVIDGWKTAATLGEFFLELGRSAAFVIKSVVRVNLAIAFKGIELAVGVRSATAIIETSTAMLELTGELAGKIFSAEIQALAVLFYGFIDAFRVHNFGSWENDMASFILTSGVVDKMDGLRITQYPKFSKLVSDVSTGNPSKMWEIDHREYKTVLDFWGKLFVTEQNHLFGTQNVYKAYEDYAGITRIPGRYIDPKNHPYDSEEELSKCRKIVNELDIGTLVDKSGHATGVDPYGALVSDVLPAVTGLVPNFSSFPVYENTVVWPNRDGVFMQTKGNFTEKSVDPNIVEIWKGWIVSGAWGPVYTNTHSSAKTKHDAIQTNLRDLRAYMVPHQDDPLAWANCKDWADANAGIKNIMKQNMHGITLAKLLDEMKTDYPEAHKHFDPFPTGIPVFTFQDSIDFVLYMFQRSGRYPFTPKAQEVYDKIINEGSTNYLERTSVGSRDNFVFLKSVRKSTPAEITLAGNIKREYGLYIQNLRDKHQSIEDAYRNAAKEILWSTYIADTSPRTMWGYISKIRTLLMAEIQQTVNLMVGDRKAKIWEEYLKIINKVGIPLNTNRYHRLAFVGKFNQLVYATSEETERRLEKQIEKKGGKLLVNKLITTGLSSLDTTTWAIDVAKGSVLLPYNIKMDFPVYFGDIHCRIIVIENPKQTSFVVFRGTTNFWEWVVDLDFTAAEYGSIQPGENPGEYKLSLASKADTATGDIDRLIHGDPDHFALHRGFLRCWLAFKPTIEKTIKEIYKKYSIQDVIITGHSLGAGIAQIACLEFPSVPRQKQVGTVAIVPTLYSQLSGKPPIQEYEYVRPHAYMYSSPAVGDSRFGWHFSNQTSESGHVYVDGDVVTMIPFMLLPSYDTWGHQIHLESINDVLAIAGNDRGASATIWSLVSRMFRLGNLPPDLNPMRWTTNGEIDIEKVTNGVLELNLALNKHRAIRGGGVFIRLDRELEGIMSETSHDQGSSDSALLVVSKGVTSGLENMKRAHSIDNVVAALDRVALLNPDIFDVIDKEEFPTWADVPGSNIPPAINPVPAELERLLKSGHIIGTAKTTKRYAKWQIVSKQDVDPDSISMVPVQEMVLTQQQHVQQRTRAKKRRVMEGEYHGY